MPVCMLYLLFGFHGSMRQVAGAEAQIEYEKSIQVRGEKCGMRMKQMFLG